MQTGKENTGGATFATVKEGLPKKGNRKKEDGQGNEKTKAQREAEKLAKIKCFTVMKRVTWQRAAYIN